MKVEIDLFLRIGWLVGMMPVVVWGCTSDGGGSVDDDSDTPADTMSDDTDSATGDDTDEIDSGTTVDSETETGEPCVDVYPYDDGYTCAQQAAWGKCDEAWMEGYCLLSCNRCDWEPDSEVDRSGPRNVFESYTNKEAIAPTPPMGWNSWNSFACDIDEDLIKATADAMVSSGMAAVGYEYVIIDDCWHAPERDGEDRLMPDPVRFPGGLYRAPRVLSRIPVHLMRDPHKLTSGRPGGHGEIDKSPINGLVVRLRGFPQESRPVCQSVPKISFIRFSDTPSRRNMASNLWLS